MPGIRTSKLTLGGAPKKKKKKAKQIQLSDAHDFRGLLTGSSAVTFLTKGAFTWVWRACFYFHPDKHISSSREVAFH